MRIISRVIKYGDNIDTDVIIPGKYTKTINMQELADHAMEDLDPLFHEKIKHSNIIAAGSNFGCGSSREQAPLAIMLAGVKCIIAKSFARIFYRNAINIGLALFEADTDKIGDNDEVICEIGSNFIVNNTTGEQIKTTPIPFIMANILQEGGLVPYLKKNKQFKI